jgi:beta-N-acetylhexosaminidase
MTVEEKIGQLLMVHFNGESVNEDAKHLIKKVRVGGIIYYNWSNGLRSPDQIAKLSGDLQQLAAQNEHPIPLLISADQEGGLVSRLSSGFTTFPGNKALAMAGDSFLAEQSACFMGDEMRAVGVNFNLAPVVDVNSNPRNPVIGIRSFGETVETVIAYGKNALKGYKKAGILTCLKHFPGHGDVEIDSHDDLPQLKKSRKQLEEGELVPFAALAQHADAIMTAHLLAPALDPINCVTLSKYALDVLRNEIGFKGVIISDSLVMEGIVRTCSSIEEVAVRALNAGCDILLLGGKQLTGTKSGFELTANDVERIHLTLVDAVKSGLIKESRVNEAFNRVLALKTKLPAIAGKNETTSLGSLVNTPEHRALAKEIARLALQIKINKPLPKELLTQGAFAIFAPAMVEKNVRESSFRKLGNETIPFFFCTLDPTDREQESAIEIGKKSDVLVFLSYNAWKNPAQVSLMNALSNMRKPFVHIVLRDSLDAALIPQADWMITTFSPTTPSIEAALDSLSGF